MEMEINCSKEINSTTGLMNVTKTAHYLGISVYTLYSWVFQKRIPFVKLGRKLMFDPKDIIDWVNEQKHQPIENN
jgi:excisionase family DNA binding protein